MKKGFTLIELLAVIVILAIIALIATPIILGIINDAREQSKKRTAELIAKETELAYTSSLFKTDVNASDFCTYMNGNFAMDNATVTSCNDKTATVTSGNDTYSAVFNTIGEYCIEGGNPDSYGYSDNTGNVAILKEMQSKGLSCSFDPYNSSCGDDSFSINAHYSADFTVSSSATVWYGPVFCSVTESFSNCASVL